MTAHRTKPTKQHKTTGDGRVLRAVHNAPLPQPRPDFGPYQAAMPQRAENHPPIPRSTTDIKGGAPRLLTQKRDASK